MRGVKVLLVSPDPASRELMALCVRSVQRELGEELEFLQAGDGSSGLRAARRSEPDVIVADEIVSRAGGLSLTLDLRNQESAYRGSIVILLDRRQDAWLANWSGADAWFVKPVDPFELARRLVELVSTKEPV
jgi:DNA-binding response OmpR family regulator